MIETIKTIFNTGGPTVGLLIFCSIISVAIVIERSFFWLMVYFHRDQTFIKKINNQVKDLKQDILDVSSTSKDLIVQIIGSALRSPFSQFESMVEVHAREKINHLNRGLGILDTLVTVAPLLGILGTVLGIIDSFDLLGNRGLEDPSGITKGISQALISTAAGLIVAIFSLIPLNIFRHRTTTLLEKIEIAAAHIQAKINEQEKK